MARLFGRPETPGGPFITIAHGAQSALRTQNIDFVGHRLVPGLWEGVRTRRTLGATLDHHLVVIGASTSSGTTKGSRLWFRPRAPLLPGRQARFKWGAPVCCSASHSSAQNRTPSGAGQADRPWSAHHVPVGVGI